MCVKIITPPKKKKSEEKCEYAYAGPYMQVKGGSSFEAFRDFAFSKSHFSPSGKPTSF